MSSKILLDDVHSTLPPQQSFNKVNNAFTTSALIPSEETINEEIRK